MIEAIKNTQLLIEDMRKASLFSEEIRTTKIDELILQLLSLNVSVEELLRKLKDEFKGSDKSERFQSIQSRRPKKSLCDYLYEAAIRLGKPHKIYFTKDFIEILIKSGYSSKSFLRDPHRTIYNCIIQDPQKRFYRPASLFKSGFALSREVASQMQRQLALIK